MTTDAQRLYDLRTRNHDPLCPRWDFGACYCDLIRQSRDRERERLRKAVNGGLKAATNDERRAAYQTVLTMIGDGSE